MRVLSKVAIMTAVTAAVMGAGLVPALADPPAGTTPALTNIVGVGSDTTQLVLDQISKTYDATKPANPMYSWDAVNPITGATGDTIVEKAANAADKTCSTARPDGSGAGIAALGANIQDAGHPCVDFARSSRGPQASDPTGLVWAAMAKDAVSWTTPNVGTGKPTTLSTTQLNAIYTCTDTTWKSVGGTSTSTIVPVLPQASSGTRAFFLGAIGVTTPGPCVVNGTVNQPGNPNNPLLIEENTGVSQKSGGNYLTGNQYQFNNFPNSIFPYSAADWIAQKPTPAGGGHATASSAPGNLLQPQAIFGTSPIVTHAGPPVTIDTLNIPAFPTAYTRVVYNVVRNAGTLAAPALPAYLVPVFGTSAKGGFICKSDSADLKSFGFFPLGANCGALTAH